MLCATREEPEGAGMPPVFQESDIPAEYREELPLGPWMPVLTVDAETGPME